MQTQSRTTVPSGWTNVAYDSCYVGADLVCSGEHGQKGLEFCTNGMECCCFDVPLCNLIINNNKESLIT